MNQQNKPINGDGADECGASQAEQDKHACAQEAAEFLNAIREGHINPRQVLIVFSQEDANGEQSLGMMNSPGDAFRQQGLLNTALAHITSKVLGAPGREGAH